MAHVTLIICPSPTYDLDGIIPSWKHDHPGYATLSNPTDTSHVLRAGLFQPHPQAALWEGEKILADNVRALASDDTLGDVLLVSKQKTSAKFGHNVEVIVLEAPKKKDVATLISRNAHISDKDARFIASKTDTVDEALSLAKQWQYAPQLHGEGAYYSHANDHAPWCVTDAIVAGDGAKAATQLRLIMHGSQSAVGIFMQLCGFLRKVIAAGDPATTLISTQGQKEVFSRAYARLDDPVELAELISKYWQLITDTPGKTHEVIVMCFVHETAGLFRS